MIQKHELPILEYDSNSEEVIRPNHGAEQLKLPEKCVYAFLGDAVDDYAFEAEATVAETFETITRNYPVYIVKQDGMEFCLCAAQWKSRLYRCTVLWHSSCRLNTSGSPAVDNAPPNESL